MKTMPLFSYKVWSIILFTSVVVLVNEDIRKNGGFEESSTGKFLQDIRLYKHAFVLFHWAERTVKQTKITLRNSNPDIYDKTAEILEPVAVSAYDYANATVHSAKKWSYIITHQHTKTYLPIVKDNFLYYYQAFKDLLKNIIPMASWFLFESEASKYLQGKLGLLWNPVHKFVEETFSIDIDLQQISTELKSALRTAYDYSSDLYEQMIDKLNLERNLSF